MFGNGFPQVKHNPVTMIITTARGFRAEP